MSELGKCFDMRRCWRGEDQRVQQASDRLLPTMPERVPPGAN
jgi:hypothetical protein